MNTMIPMLAMALALSFTFTTLAKAGVTVGQKCAMKADLLVGKFGLCLSKADANVSKGKATDTTAADPKCSTRLSEGWTKVRDKAEEKDPALGANCGGKMHDSMRDMHQASALVGYGRSLSDYAGLNTSDLSFHTMNSTGMSSLASQNCIAGGGAYDWICGVNQADAEEPTSDCCTAPSTYDCWHGSYCSQMADRYPPEGGDGAAPYANIYEGHTPNTGEPLAGGCNTGTGGVLWVMGQSWAVDVNQKNVICGTP